jgi:hypothetical protein
MSKGDAMDPHPPLVPPHVRPPDWFPQVRPPWFPRQNTPNWKFPQSSLNFPKFPHSFPNLQKFPKSSFKFMMLEFLLNFDFKAPFKFKFKKSF